MAYRFDTDTDASCQINLLPDIYRDFIGYKHDGFFVELGAFDGYSWSNTLPLIEAGWRGIMVEPDPQSFAKLCRRHQQNPNLTLVQAAVSDENETVKLYPGGSSSTIVPKMVGIFSAIPGYPMEGMSDTNFVDVIAYKMDDLLAVYECPPVFDVLSVDVEGAEMQVMAGYDVDKHRPKLAIVEGDEKHTASFIRFNTKGVYEYFVRHGYKRIYYDRLNSIYLDTR